MYAQKFSNSFSRAFKIILAIWLLSASMALPYLFVMGVYFEYPEYEETKACSILEAHRETMRIVIQLTVLFLFIVPMTLISIMYVLIGITLWKSQKKHRNMSQGQGMSIKLSNKNAKPSRDAHTEICDNDDMSMNVNGENIANENTNVKRFKSDDGNKQVKASGVIVNDTNKAREAITRRARQSRRDVVKMLCKCFLLI
jgi:hypothetical protein